MDNVTHTLAGLLLAESAVRWRGRRVDSAELTAFRAAAVISSPIAANLPDGDLFYTGFGGDRLSYMLHHRGYTHTIVMAVAGAVLMWAIVVGWWRWRGSTRPSPTDGRWLFGLLTVATLSHLALDWTNSYGVHLFWPFDNHWQYGDSVFIVEPWLWVVSIPALVAAVHHRVSRVLLSLALIAVLAVAWMVEFVSPGTAIALTGGSIVTILVARVLSPGRRVATAAVAWIVATCVMAAGARTARASVLHEALAANPSGEILDVIVTPLPGNPLCASVMTVERTMNTYRVVTVRASAAPALVAAADCRTRSDAGGTFKVSTRESSRRVVWEREWSADVGELIALARESCRAAAALRFLRVPIWSSVADSTVVLGDARFGDGSGNSFSDERVLRQSPHCGIAVPPWIPPRSDLFEIPARPELPR
jgi:inner membrane protein